MDVERLNPGWRQPNPIEEEIPRYTMKAQRFTGETGMRRVIWVTVLCSAFAVGGTAFDSAQKLYDRTDYASVVRVLQAEQNKDGRTWELLGKSYFMMADFKKATDAFEHAVVTDPRSSNFHLWLGRTWGRRAETSNAFLAPGYASKARQFFEKAVALDGANKEALNDLFEYYMQAPGILGGGSGKAEALIQKIAARDEAEGYFAQAQLSDRRKDFDMAERQLRRAADLAPRQVGRILDLASYLSKRGRVQDSEAAFAHAEKLAPNSPKVIYARAETYVRDGRNLPQARELLQKYLALSLTPDDPPREKAQELLRKASGA